MSRKNDSKIHYLSWNIDGTEFILEKPAEAPPAEAPAPAEAT